MNHIFTKPKIEMFYFYYKSLHAENKNVKNTFRVVAKNT